MHGGGTRYCVAFTFVFLMLLLTGCRFLTRPVESPGQGPVPHRNALEVAHMINLYRAGLGLDTLEWDNRLFAVALGHSIDMRLRHFFSHINPDGNDSFVRLALAGIRYERAGENIARGQTSPASVMRSWLFSPAHRHNIENPCYSYQGIGYDSVGHFWTHVFVSPPEKVEPHVGGVLFIRGMMGI